MGLALAPLRVVPERDMPGKGSKEEPKGRGSLRSLPGGKSSIHDSTNHDESTRAHPQCREQGQKRDSWDAGVKGQNSFYRNEALNEAVLKGEVKTKSSL